MKKLKNLVLMFITFLMVFITASCGSVENPNTSDKGNATTEIVNIKHLKASKNIKENVNEDVRMRSRGLVVSAEEEKSAQYTIIYKSESEITFTIELQNPKGEAIDAIEITCDDEASEIMVDGVYKKIQFDEVKKSRIVNWAQEDPYEKVYNIKTTSEADVNTIKVLDIKVNGAWQNKELSNDELNVYKITEETFNIETVYNIFDEYRFKVNHTANVANIVVEGAVANEDGTYSKAENGEINVSYDLTVKENLTVNWKETRTIELLKVWHSTEADVMFYIEENNFLQIYINISGTDINSVILILDENEYKLNFVNGNPEVENSDKWFEGELPEKCSLNNESENIKIKISNNYYIINKSNLEKIELIKE